MTDAFNTLYSLLLRLELYKSGNRIIHSENLNSYNLSVTLHGLIMIFFIIIPVLYGGLANYLLPIYILAPEMSFPRINYLSLLILPFSYNYLLISLCTEFSTTTGWTFYPPLSTSLPTPPVIVSSPLPPVILSFPAPPS